VSELIIIYIAKIIEKDNMNKNKNKNNKIKINESQLTNGIFKDILYDLVNNKLTNDKYNQFCRTYIKLINNKKDRSYPRTSKKPFSKWYVKGYSNNSQLVKMILAILNKTVH